MPDGASRREQYLDGYTCVYFKNGDVRQIFPEGTDLVEQRSSVYYYKEASITQTEYRHGVKVTLFPNGQIEKLNVADGSKQILYNDGTKKTIPGASAQMARQIL